MADSTALIAVLVVVSIVTLLAVIGALWILSHVSIGWV